MPQSSMRHQGNYILDTRMHTIHIGAMALKKLCPIHLTSERAIQIHPWNVRQYYCQPSATENWDKRMVLLETGRNYQENSLKVLKERWQENGLQCSMKVCNRQPGLLPMGMQA